MDSLVGGGRYMLGPALDGAPAKLDGRTVGHVKDGRVVITDEAAQRLLRRGESLGLSIGPVDREGWS